MQHERIAVPAPSPGLKDRLRALYHRLPAPPSTTYTMPGHEHPNPLGGMSGDLVIFDIGAKRVKEYGGWPFPAGARVTRIDIDPMAEPDIVADAHDLHMIADASADMVICSDVLEHCERPWVVIRELHRILKPGGRIFLSIPFMFPYHADPHDHWRASYTGIEHLCRGLFHKIGSGYQRGPASCMAHLNIHFFALLFSFNSKALYGVLVDLGKWAFAWTKVLDRLLARHPMRHVIHAGVWYLGEKA